MKKKTVLFMSWLTLWMLGQSMPVSAQVVLPESYSSSTVKTDAHTRARLHTELAALYLQVESTAVALEETGIAIQADPSYAPAYNVRGLVYMILGETAAAEKDFKQALSLAPGDSEANNNYGWFLCQQGRNQESLSYFLAAVRNPLYNTPEKAYANAGACALKAGELDNAAKYLQQALRTAPAGDPMIGLQLAKLAYMRGNPEAARMALLQVTSKMPAPNAESLWLGLRIERKLGNRSDEASYAAQLQRLFPASPEYQEFLKGNYE